MAKNSANKKIAKPAFVTSWYYMATTECSVEEIKKAIDSEGYNIEIWKEAGVLEVEIAEKCSMDFEECDLDLRDEYSNQFLESNGVKSLFFVNLPKTDFSLCEKVMKKIIVENGGFFCADTDDFSPMVK